MRLQDSNFAYNLYFILFFFNFFFLSCRLDEFGENELHSVLLYYTKRRETYSTYSFLSKKRDTDKILDVTVLVVIEKLNLKENTGFSL